MRANNPKGLLLSQNQIDIWLLFCPAPYDLIDHILPFLADEEIHRMNKYYFRRDQIKFAISRYHLKELLGKYLDQTSKNIVIEYRKYSKPFIGAKHHSHIKFNISHSGEMFIYAFSLDQDIGIDIEKYNANVDVMKISKKYFSKEEKKILYTAEKKSIFNLFYNIWTCKEAYLKYNEIGLNTTINSFSIYPQKENLLSLLPIIYEKMKYFDSQDKYFTALCTPYFNPRISVHYFDNKCHHYSN